MRILVLILALVALTAFAQDREDIIDVCTNLGVTIDDFSQKEGTFDKLTLVQGDAGNRFVSADPYTGSTVGQNWAYAADTFPMGNSNLQDFILGGYRDVIVYIDQNSNPAPRPGTEAAVNINVGPANRPQLQVNVDQGVKSVAEIQWDGNLDNSNPLFFDKSGLGGVDLVAGADSFTIDLDDTDLGVVIRIEAWSYAGGNAAASQGVRFDWVSGAGNSRSFRFGDFSPITAGASGVEVFRSLGAMRFIITSTDPLLPETDLVIFSLSTSARICMWKSAASCPSPKPTNTDDYFSCFFGLDSDAIEQTMCKAGNPFTTGETMSYFIQAYSVQENELSYDIVDQLPAEVRIIPSSVLVHIHNEEQDQISTVVSVSNNRLTVSVTVNEGVADSRVSVFFDVVIQPVDIVLSTCNYTVSNRATLNTGDVILNSFDWDGLESVNRPTTFCFQVKPLFNLAFSYDGPNIVPGEAFSVDAFYSNIGQLDSPQTLLTLTVLEGDLQVSNLFTRVDDVTYSSNIGAVDVGSFYNPLSTIHRVPASFDGTVIRLQLCITNLQPAADGCVDEVCQELSVFVGGEGNLKLCKRAKLVRRLYYTVDYVNVGNGAARNVVVEEHIPVGATFNSRLSDDRWACDVTGRCVIFLDSLPAMSAGCAPFVVDVMAETPVCTMYNNTATLILDADYPEVGIIEDNSASWNMQQAGCPFECEEPSEPECCACPPPPSPPPMCPCPEPDPCDECADTCGFHNHHHHDDCDSEPDDCEEDSCHGHGRKATTINFDFSGLEDYL